ncbi:MAG: hypothetical protein MUO64_05805 [Anaerolineales bacterium]|nr:hypothetical protein [Anaerolineales bacterium]
MGTRKTPSGRPGTPAPSSGQYRPRGQPKAPEITAVEGKPLPPTPKPGQTWVLVDETKHEDDKKK